MDIEKCKLCINSFYLTLQKLDGSKHEVCHCKADCYTESEKVTVEFCKKHFKKLEKGDTTIG